MKEVGIISLLSKEINDYSLSLRKRLVEKFDLDINFQVPAHITLKYKFPVVDISVIEQVAEKFCSVQVKTRLKIQGFNVFENPDHHVVFMDVSASNQVREIHAHFLDRLRKIDWVSWGELDHADLHYHVTLVNGVPDDKILEIWNFVMQLEEPDFETYFDNLTFVAIDDSVRSIYQTYCFSR